MAYSITFDKGHSYFLGNVGEFYKGGAGGTVFWVDPNEDLVAVFMTTLPALRNHYRHLIKSRSSFPGLLVLRPEHHFIMLEITA